MKRLLGPLALLVGVFAVPLRAQSTQAWWELAGAADSALLRQRSASIDILLDDFDIAYREWTIRELETPLLKRHAVYEFVGANAQGLRSQFVLIVDRSAPPDARPAGLVVPLLYTGSAHEHPQVDLNTIGVFNRMMQDEAFHATASADWIELAVVYLTLAGDQPQPLDNDNLGAVRAALPKRTAVAAPQIRALPDGGVELTMFSLTSPSVYGTSDLVGWVFDFDARGLLRNLETPLWVPFGAS